MPTFSPKIGTTTIAPREPFWKRWYKHHRLKLAIGGVVVVVGAMITTGWWIWQGQYVPAHGGTVTEGLVGQPSRLNPLFSANNLVDAELTPLIFRGLLKYNTKQELVPDLASSWHKSDDGKVYTVTLGQHKWHDDQPITAQDVAFTIKLTQNPSYHGSWSKSFTDVAVNVKSPFELEMTLKEPFAPFAQSLTMGLLPKHILDNKSIDQLEKDPFNVQPIGSGPLRFASLELNQQTHEFNVMRFTPIGGYLDTINFQFYPTVEAMITDFKLGKIQSLGGSYDPAFDDLKSFPDKQQRDVPLLSQSYGLFINLHSQPMTDIGLRQAMAYALPKKQLLSTVFNGQVTPLNGVYQPDFWAFSQRAETYDFNQAKAEDLWDKVETKPKTIRLLVPDKAIYQQLGAAIGQAWQKIGISVSVITRNPKDMGTVVNAHRDYDVVLLGEQSDADPDRYSIWHSTQMPPTGLNITGESNKRVDKALEDGRKALSTDDRKSDYDIFQYYLAKDAPVIWLYQPKYIYIWSNKVKGVQVADNLLEPQDRLAGVAKWYVKTQRR